MDMTAIAIVAIICWTIVKLTGRDKPRKVSKSDYTSAAENAALKQQMDAMQERIEVLERIVTDEKYDLQRQFDALKKDTDRAA